MKKIDGFDDCIVGVVERINMTSMLCYDPDKIVSKLIREHQMSWEEAQEHFDFNIRDSYVGEDTPCYLRVWSEQTETNL
jgi:hypothetical protein